MFTNNSFINNDINNGALNFVNAMPQKDSTTDGTSDFEMGRKVYVQTSRVNGFIQQPQNNQKKWLGNRDASQITANKRVKSIGKGTINTDTHNLISFTTYKDVNTVNDALRRCRSGGAIAPPKCAARVISGLTPSFQPAADTSMNYLKQTYGLKLPSIYH
jgi:hypothetical protein